MTEKSKIQKKIEKSKFRLVFSCLSLSSFFLSLSLCLSLSPCDVVCDVVCGSACGVCGVCARCGVCGVSIQNVTVCTDKMSPCMLATRAHVDTHVRVVPVDTGTFGTYTRGRFEWTHGRSHRQFRLPTFAHEGLSRASEVHQRNPWIFSIVSLRIGREQHVADSSNLKLSS